MRLTFRSIFGVHRPITSLTLRSTRQPTATRLAGEAASTINCVAGQARCRWLCVASNVTRRRDVFTHRLGENGKINILLWLSRQPTLSTSKRRESLEGVFLDRIQYHRSHLRPLHCCPDDWAQQPVASHV